MSLDPERADAPDGSSAEDVLWLLRRLATQLEAVEDELSADGAPTFPVETHRSLTQVLGRIRDYAEAIGDRAERDWSRP